MTLGTRYKDQKGQLFIIGAFSRDCEIFVNPRFKLYSVSLVSRNFSQISPLVSTEYADMFQLAGRLRVLHMTPCSGLVRQPGVAWNTVDIIETLWLQSHRH